MQNYRSVSEVCGLLNDVLQNFNGIVFQGEVSEFTNYRGSGHWYFTLKDDCAQIRCVMFSRDNARTSFIPAVGSHVVVKGRIGLYEKSGSLQCTVQYMKPMGAGQLYEQFLQLKSKLESEGLFAPEHKKRIQKVPKSIGIITGLQTAALRDVLQRLGERAPYADVVVYPSPVQGLNAHSEIIRAIERANERQEVQTLLLVRGGGSIEDLWSFNEESLARAIYASVIPIVTGIGHESDVTIADLAADVRASTPTAAAEVAALSRNELENGLAHLSESLQDAWERGMDQRWFRTDRASVPFASPQAFLKDFYNNLARYCSVLSQSMERCCLMRREFVKNGIFALQKNGTRVDFTSLDACTERLKSSFALAGRNRELTWHRQQSILEALSPKKVLDRGYAWVRKDERAISSVQDLREGDRISILLIDGEVNATVDGRKVLPADSR